MKGYCVSSLVNLKIARYFKRQIVYCLPNEKGEGLMLNSILQGQKQAQESAFQYKPLAAAIILATASLSSGLVQAATYNVLNTNDSGAGSL